jgi:hypothetical protein
VNVEHNFLQRLPTSIGGCADLRELHLSYNALSELPPAVGCLVGLQVLTAAHCGLRAVPQELGMAKALTTLRLGGNLLHIVPVSLGRLRSLTVLDLSGNPLRADMAERLEQTRADPRRFVAFLASLERAGAYAPLCYAHGPGLCAGVRPLEPVTVTIQAVDYAGDAKHLGGDVFVVRLVGKADLAATVRDRQDGTHEAEFEAPLPGNYFVHVTLHGEHIQGSPFALTVAAERVDPARTVVEGPGLADGTAVGAPQHVLVMPRDERGRPVRLSDLRFEVHSVARRKSVLTGPVAQFEVVGPTAARGVATCTSPGAFRFELDRSRSGSYALFVRLDGRPVSQPQFSYVVVPGMRMGDGMRFLPDAS